MPEQRSTVINYNLCAHSVLKLFSPLMAIFSH